MKFLVKIWIPGLILCSILFRPCYAQQAVSLRFDFCGQPLTFAVPAAVSMDLNPSLSQETITSFYQHTLDGNYSDVVRALNTYKEVNHPDDWLFYQLVRRTAEQLSPKAANYNRYTLFKWFLLASCGYDPAIRVSHDKILFYVQSDENIYNVPTHTKNGRQYVCLNYHDYGGNIDFSKELFHDIQLPIGDHDKPFSYKITQIPDFKTTEYLQKDIHFNYAENDYHFKVKLSPQVEKLFINYPVVDFDSYMNIPMSRETYNSLLPQLRKNIKGLSTKNGVDYLMRFTRYAFLFETDTKRFGMEKRLSPEQTLFFNESDCEDRVALFYYLVKEIYDLPMIVLTYPGHVTLAVQFDKPVGKSILYEGRKYSICEPTPQQQDLAVGESLPELSKVPYEVAYSYVPHRK